MPQHSLTVGGQTYEVDFPYAPYDCQLTMMEKVLESLTTGRNALLESPTGTGKTLCLLCAALGWREAHARQGGGVPRGGNPRGIGQSFDASRAPGDAADASASGSAGAGISTDRGDTNRAPPPSESRGPVIIYASRTHSQLAQVIKELKATKYRPRMAVLGSRTQMCVHKEVRRLTGVAQQTACRQKTESRTCAHYNETDRFLRSDPEYGKREPVDIEDLVKLGEKGKVGGGCGPCPYYASQDMAARADIVFAPYNYLIDPKLRETFGNRVRWNDAVLLFDEAHNVEGACAEAASFELPAANLAAAVREAQEAFELAAAEEELSAHAAEPDRLLFNARGRGGDDGFGGTGEKLGVNGMKRVDGGDRDGLTKRTALEYKQLRGILLALESKIASELDKGSVKSPGTSAFAEKAHFAKELVKPCAYFFDVLASLRITDEPAIAVSDVGEGGGGVKKVSSVQLLVAVMRDAALLLASEAASGGAQAKSRVSSFRLVEVADALEKAFAVRKSGQMESFRVRIGTPDTPFSNSHRGGFSGGGSGSATHGGPTLSFWCFTPGVAMRALKDKGARCVVLASGTLSPMSSFASELALPFPVRLENPHVIAPDQVWGGVVPVGPSGKRLNSSYRFRDTDEYKAELGNAIVNFARVVPDGLLVFFPSYGVMRACVEFWRSHGAPSVWDRICNAKHAVVEPQDKKEFAAAFAEFNAALGLRRAKGQNERAGDDDGGVENGVARHRGGAAFFAVCRGKVSEGIDFPDKAGRAVILTGIPYAPKADAKVRLKRSFLDEKKAASERESNTIDARERGDRVLLSGEAWYSQSAMRAVNQALGRVIRHRHDHGAVILLDERFGYGDTRNQLSVWLRPAIQSFDAFGPAAAQLSRFFKRCATRARDEHEKHLVAAGDDASARGSPNSAGGERNINSKRAAGETSAGAAKEGAPSLFGGAIPKRFRVDPDAAPPAYPRAKDGRTPVGLIAALTSGSRGNREGDTFPGGPNEGAVKRTDEKLMRAGNAAAASVKKSGSLSAMLARARDVSAPPTRGSEETPNVNGDAAHLNGSQTPSTTVTQKSFLSSDRQEQDVATRGGAICVDPVRLFMRRARHELSAASHDALQRALRDFKANGDAAAVLRAANRLLRAEEDPSKNGLYAMFAVLVPETHKRAHAAHLNALRARKDGESEKDSDAASKKMSPPPKRARVASSSLSRDPPDPPKTASSTRSASVAASVAVARPPPRCVLCGNACRKPFEAKCGHPACYACWLAHIAGRTGAVSGSSSQCACPSCHQPVIKRQLTKVFFT
uniref:DNA helicase n=1 Tax=Micromonas pusilla TaxID=38833 RepID=A0A7S0H0B7_MICPS|mmetsp:Transcript_9331/g.39613  ORF Transcript_9331/g.39613 Transcript_9331/m.39613 type:complete len:1292 (+) Transcript_9331:57-3932(+)